METEGDDGDAESEKKLLGKAGIAGPFFGGVYDEVESGLPPGVVDETLGEDILGSSCAVGSCGLLSSDTC